MKTVTSGAQQDLKKNRLYKLSILGILFGFLLLSIILSITLGATHIPIKKAFHALFVEKEGLTYHIIMNIRMPRTLVGMLVGISLSSRGLFYRELCVIPLPHLILSVYQAEQD